MRKLKSIVIPMILISLTLSSCGKTDEPKVEVNNPTPKESHVIETTKPEETWTPQTPNIIDTEDDEVYVHTKSPELIEWEEELGEEIMDPLEGFSGQKIESETTLPGTSSTFKNSTLLHGSEYLSDCDIEVLDVSNWESVDRIISNPNTYVGQMIKVYGKYYIGDGRYGTLFGNQSSNDIKIYSDYELSDATSYLIVGEILNMENENGDIVPYIDCYTIYSAY